MDYNIILKEAAEKGNIAMAACKPVQYQWGQAESLTSNKIVGPTETHGDLGGAYITGIPGKCDFVNWAKKHNPDLIQRGVYKGYDMYLHKFKATSEDEVDKNMAFAEAFAEVLKSHGIVCRAKSYLS